MSDSDHDNVIYSAMCNELDNDDDLEVAAVLERGAQGLYASNPLRRKSSVSMANSDSPICGGLMMSLFRPPTVLTNVARGNTATGTPSIGAGQNLYHLVAKGELWLLRDLITDENVNVEDENGLTFLMWAGFYNQLSTAHFLISLGANVDASCPALGGVTSLTVASSRGHSQMISLLLRAGADVNFGTSTGNTPLICCAYFNHPECSKILLEHGADLTLENSDKLSTMDFAMRLGHREVEHVINDHIKKLFGDW